MSSTQLIAFFEQRRALGTPMALVTVIETAGSTYSKVGARMLIDASGACHGLVSGGCLEGDLVEHAREVLQSGLPRHITYDLRADHEDLWGLGVGCDGMLRVLVQPLTAAGDHEPMRSLVQALQSDSVHSLTLVTESSHPGYPLGTTLLRDLSAREQRGTGASLAAMLQSAAQSQAAGPGVTRFAGSLDSHPLVALRQVIHPLPRVLVLGAGADAVPVVEGFNTLGWRVEIADHRETVLRQHAFGSARRLLLTDDDVLQACLRERPPTAVIMMSHNLQRDLRNLSLVARVDCVYLGVLGPRHRHDRLVNALDLPTRALLAGRLKGPVGLDLGADSPASIALAIVAQVFTEVKQSVTDSEFTSGHATRRDQASGR